MGDIISRQAAIDALKRYFERINRLKKNGLSIAERAICEDVQGVIHLAPSAQKWIPCSERLPSARQSVIISTKDWTGEGCYWETTEHHVIWKGYRWNATYWDDEVIAWQPLPEPYKEEEECI